MVTPQLARIVERVSTETNPQALLRLPQVLALIPVSKSTWWNGVKNGKFPRPIKLTERTTCWRARDILAFIEKAALTGGHDDER
jgi:predicted DNA-binding transcriptional regulator AlpA